MGDIVSGDFSKLDRWMRDIDRLSKPATLRDLANDLSLEGVALVGTDFTYQRAPHGQGWARKKIPDGRPVGQKTGALRFSYRPLRVSPNGFRIGPAGPARKYAGIFHRGRGPVHAKPGGVLRFQVGSRVYFRKSVGPAPARPLVPERGRLPHTWDLRFQQTANRWFQRQFR